MPETSRVGSPFDREWAAGRGASRRPARAWVWTRPEAMEGRILLATSAGTVVAAVEGRLFSGEVGTLVAPGASGPAVAYSASIDWGDATPPTAGVLSMTGPGAFSARGDHAYARSGPYAITITVGGPDGSSTVIRSRAEVANAPFRSAGVDLLPTAGAPFAGVVATFSDDDPSAVAADYLATIDWGDGQSSLGSVAATSPGAFSVTGTRTYAAAGTYATRIAILDAGESQETIASGTARVVATSALATGSVVAPVEGRPFGGVVASFAPGNSGLDAGNSQATIDWGDGQFTAGSIAANAAGGFDVSGIHTYRTRGSYPLVTAVGGPFGRSLVAIGRADVADAAITLTPATVRPIAGRLYTGVVASITDANPAGRAGDYRAVIDWGDGHNSEGTIVPNPSGGLDVVGSNTYATQTGVTPTRMPFAITVRVFGPAGTSATTAASLAFVGGPAEALTGALDPSSDRGESAADGITNVNRPTFRGTADPFSIVQVFAQVANSDPSVRRTLGQVVAGPDGIWSVTSSTLPDGTYTITASITRPAGSPTAPIPLMPYPLAIDTIAPRVAALAVARRSGVITAVVADVGVGLDLASLANPAHYTLTGPRTPRGRDLDPSDTPSIAGTYTTARAQTVRITPPGQSPAGRYRLRLASGGIADRAGNPLDGEPRGRFPSGDGEPYGSFLATITIPQAHPRPMPRATRATHGRREPRH